MNGKGVVLHNLGQHEEAITWYDKVLEIDENDIIAINNKGNALANLGKCDEAITWFDKAAIY